MNEYTLMRRLGCGSFGSAHLAVYRNSGEKCVLKQIKIQHMTVKEISEARKEVEVLSSLSHPYIVQFLHSFEDGGHLFIAMDYCAGGDLHTLISKRDGVYIPEDRVLDWFAQLCLAVKYIHDRHILHRDIKSQNVFLTADGRVRLGDFGIAKVLGSTSELTRTCIGTPYYLSPEMCENRPYNNKSDIWALGCVLYETAALRQAFEATNMKQLVAKIVNGKFPPLPTGGKYSRDLRSLVEAIFQREPQSRPSVTGILRRPFLLKRAARFIVGCPDADDLLLQLHQRDYPRKPPVRPRPRGVTDPAAKYGTSQSWPRPKGRSPAVLSQGQKGSPLAIPAFQRPMKPVVSKVAEGQIRYSRNIEPHIRYSRDIRPKPQFPNTDIHLSEKTSLEISPRPPVSVPRTAKHLLLKPQIARVAKGLSPQKLQLMLDSSGFKCKLDFCDGGDAVSPRGGQSRISPRYRRELGEKKRASLVDSDESSSASESTADLDSGQGQLTNLIQVLRDIDSGKYCVSSDAPTPDSPPTPPENLPGSTMTVKRRPKKQAPPVPPKEDDSPKSDEEILEAADEFRLLMQAKMKNLVKDRVDQLDRMIGEHRAKGFLCEMDLLEGCVGGGESPQQQEEDHIVLSPPEEFAQRIGVSDNPSEDLDSPLVIDPIYDSIIDPIYASILDPMMQPAPDVIPMNPSVTVSSMKTETLATAIVGEKLELPIRSSYVATAGVGPRGCWGAASSGGLESANLESTGSEMDATTAADTVTVFTTEKVWRSAEGDGKALSPMDGMGITGSPLAGCAVVSNHLGQTFIKYPSDNNANASADAECASATSEDLLHEFVDNRDEDLGATLGATYRLLERRESSLRMARSEENILDAETEGEVRGVRDDSALLETGGRGTLGKTQKRGFLRMLRARMSQSSTANKGRTQQPVDLIVSSNPNQKRKEPLEHATRSPKPITGRTGIVGMLRRLRSKSGSRRELLVRSEGSSGGGSENASPVGERAAFDGSWQRWSVDHQPLIHVDIPDNIPPAPSKQKQTLMQELEAPPPAIPKRRLSTTLTAPVAGFLARRRSSTRSQKDTPVTPVVKAKEVQADSGNGILDYESDWDKKESGVFSLLDNIHHMKDEDFKHLRDEDMIHLRDEDMIHLRDEDFKHLCDEDFKHLCDEDFTHLTDEDFPHLNDADITHLRDEDFSHLFFRDDDSAHIRDEDIAHIKDEEIMHLKYMIHFREDDKSHFDFGGVDNRLNGKNGKNGKNGSQSLTETRISVDVEVPPPSCREPTPTAKGGGSSNGVSVVTREMIAEVEENESVDGRSQSTPSKTNHEQFSEESPHKRDKISEESTPDEPHTPSDFPPPAPHFKPAWDETRSSSATSVGIPEIDTFNWIQLDPLAMHSTNYDNPFNNLNDSEEDEPDFPPPPPSLDIQNSRYRLAPPGSNTMPAAQDDHRSCFSPSEIWHIGSDGGVVCGGGEVFGWIEEQRAHLEEELGLEVFMRAFRLLEDAEERDGTDLGPAVSAAKSMLPSQLSHLTHEILQLVIAEAAYDN